jgi:hypothetical protein
MRFLVMVKPPTAAYESGMMPSPELVANMGAFNAELVKAGVLLAAEGLHPSSKGARSSFAGGKPTVSDGPFAETKELVGGFWLIQVKSKEEAISWMRRAPFGEGVRLEIRQVYEFADLAPSDPTGEHRARELELRAVAASRKA